MTPAEKLRAAELRREYGDRLLNEGNVRGAQDAWRLANELMLNHVLTSWAAKPGAEAKQ